MNWSWTQFFSVLRDVLSVGLAGLGAYLAYLAIKMGQEHGQIAKRQAEIAEKQDRIMQEQLGRKAELELVWGRIMYTDRMSTDVYRMEVWNHGNKSVRSFYWDIIVPEDCLGCMEVVGNASSDVNHVEGYGIMEGAKVAGYKRFAGFYGRDLFPSMGVECGVLNVNMLKVPEHRRNTQATVYIRATFEDGTVPGDGELQPEIVYL